MTEYTDFKGKYKELKKNVVGFVNLIPESNIQQSNIQQLIDDYNKREEMVKTQMGEMEDTINTPPVPFRNALRYLCGDVLQMLENYDKPKTSMVSRVSSVFSSAVFSNPSYSKNVDEKLFDFSVQEFSIINNLLDEINKELIQKIQQLKSTGVESTGTSNTLVQSGGKGKRRRTRKGKGKGKRRRTRNKKI